MNKKTNYDKFYKYGKSLANKWLNSKNRIYEKLLLKGATKMEATKILSDLEKEGYLNDDHSFDITLFALEEKRYGYKRIKEKLLEKGFSMNLISTYIFNKDIEMEKAKYYFSKGIKKYPNYRYSDSEREKIINFLKRYGFNDKIIAEVIKTGINYENVK